MGFFGNLFSVAKRKQAEMRDRREFLDLVDKRTKPIRRQYYLKQMLQEAIKEGRLKAQQDSQKRVPTKQKIESDFGLKEEKIPKETTLMDGINNPYKYLEGHPGFNNQQTKSKKVKKK